MPAPRPSTASTANPADPTDPSRSAPFPYPSVPHEPAIEVLTEAAATMMKRAGYPLVFTEPMGIETNSHQCGTVRFGNDPATVGPRPVLPRARRR